MNEGYIKFIIDQSLRAKGVLEAVQDRKVPDSDFYDALVFFQERGDWQTAAYLCENRGLPRKAAENYIKAKMPERAYSIAQTYGFKDIVDKLTPKKENPRLN